MKFHDEEIPIGTTRRFQIVDVTGPVERAVERSGIAEGFVIVSSPHTTAAIRVNEKDDRLHEDMEDFLKGLCDPRGSFRHDARTADGRPNAWGHIMSLLMGSSAAIPVSAGRPVLGGWQAVFFVELDGPRENRKARVKVIGE